MAARAQATVSGSAEKPERIVASRASRRTRTGSSVKISARVARRRRRARSSTPPVGSTIAPSGTETAMALTVKSRRQRSGSSALALEVPEVDVVVSHDQAKRAEPFASQGDQASAGRGGETPCDRRSGVGDDDIEIVHGPLEAGVAHGAADEVERNSRRRFRRARRRANRRAASGRPRSGPALRSFRLRLLRLPRLG